MSSNATNKQERALLKHAIRITNKFNLNEDVHGPCIITTQHCEAGVRTNGRAKQTGLMEIFDDFVYTKNRIINSLTDIAQCLVETSNFIETFNRLYQRCPDCKGLQGDAQHYNGWQDWIDCMNCDGKGYVANKKMLK